MPALEISGVSYRASRSGSAYQDVVSRILGRFAAVTERDAATVKFFVRDDKGVPLNKAQFRPVSADQLDGRFAGERDALKERMRNYRPATPVEQTVHRALSEAFERISAGAGRNYASDCLFSYRDAAGKWRLVWCWGYARLGREPTLPKVCRVAECRLLYLERPGEKGKCPRCGATQSQHGRGVLRNLGKALSVAAVLGLLLVAAGLWWRHRSSAVLTGNVVDIVSGQPLAGATLSDEESDSRAVTDSAGRFRLDHLHGGRVKIAVKAPGFHQKRLQPELLAGRENNLSVRLLGDGILAGEVVQSAGRTALGDAEVCVVGTPLAAYTDPSGKFRIEGIPSGRRGIVVAAEGFVSQRLDKELASGRTTSLRVLMPGSASLAGEVVSAADQKPLAGAEIRLTGTSLSCASGKDGTFRLEGIPGGHATIEVEAKGFCLGRVENDFAPDRTTPVRVALVGGAILAGDVVDEVGHAPIADAEARIADTTLAARSNAQGRFRLEGPKSGPARIEIKAAGYAAQTLDRSLALGGETEVHVVLAGDGAIAGLVVTAAGDEPVKDAEVRLKGTPRVATTDARGKFRFDKVRSGRACLEAKAQRLGCKQVTQELAAGRETPVRLALTGEVLLTGEVVDAQSAPIPEAEVRIEGGKLAAKTDLAGRFSVANVRGGPAKINVSAVGFLPSVKELRLAADAESHLHVVLTGDAVLVGEVTTSENRPVEEAEVQIAGRPLRTKTAADGRFRLEGASSGAATVLVSAAGLRSQRISQQLASGQETRLHVVLKGDAALSGDVVDAVTKDPVCGAQVRVAETALAATTDEQGRFHFEGLPRQSVKLSAKAAGYRAKDAEIQLAGDPNGKLRLELEGSASLTGEVLNAENQRPIAEAEVVVDHAGCTAQTDKDGRFRLEKVPSGPAKLAVSAPGFVAGECQQQLADNETATVRVLLKPEAAAPTPPAPDTVVDVPQTPEPPSANREGIYSLRTLPHDAEMINRLGGTAESERAVADGLAWLARHQADDGHWGPGCLRNRPDGCCSEGAAACPNPGGDNDPAHTGLAVLAFQAGGHFSFNGRKYSEVVRKGLDWLVDHQGPDGMISNDGSMYEHGMAAFALAEACAVARAAGETPDPRYLQAAQAGIKFIEQGQHNDGGWRYSQEKREGSDTSVTGWQVLAINSAREAKIPVSPKTIKGIAKYFGKTSDPKTGTTGYLFGQRGSGGDAMTGVGMLMHEFLLKRPRDPLVSRGAHHLAGTAQEHAAQPDYYLLYNCTLAMYRAGGKYWQPWNDVVRDAVVKLQRHDGCTSGSWDVGSGTGSRGGRICSTAWAVLTLEVYYRYAREGAKSEK
jgi:hypothetical protein